jgi:hypothetical protein
MKLLVFTFRKRTCLYVVVVNIFEGFICTVHMGSKPSENPLSVNQKTSSTTVTCCVFGSLRETLPLTAKTAGYHKE